MSRRPQSAPPLSSVADQPRVTPEHFDRLYANDPDPWKFATSDYERDKYAATLAALPRPRYDRAFEVGCSIGVLTRQLAARCDEILAVDVAEAALQNAAARCNDLPRVQFARMVVPQDWPEGKFDLILFSEVLYYLSAADRLTAARLSLHSLLPGGTIILVNWHGPTDGDCSGDEAAKQFIAACATILRPVLQQRAEKYRIDVLFSHLPGLGRRQAFRIAKIPPEAQLSSTHTPMPSALIAAAVSAASITIIPASSIAPMIAAMAITMVVPRRKVGDPAECCGPSSQGEGGTHIELPVRSRAPPGHKHGAKRGSRDNSHDILRERLPSSDDIKVPLRRKRGLFVVFAPQRIGRQSASRLIGTLPRRRNPKSCALIRAAPRDPNPQREMSP